jgi:hypothetical protein
LSLEKYLDTELDELDRSKFGIFIPEKQFLHYSNQRYEKRLRCKHASVDVRASQARLNGSQAHGGQERPVAVG